MLWKTSFGALDISFQSLTSANVNPCETPNPLKNYSPSTSASNIYPALKNMAAVLLPNPSTQANIPTTDKLGNIQSVKWGIFDR